MAGFRVDHSTASVNITIAITYADQPSIPIDLDAAQRALTDAYAGAFAELSKRIEAQRG